MPTIVRFLCLFIFININLFSDILFNLSEFNSSRRPTSNPYFIAIMVEFEEENWVLDCSDLYDACFSNNVE